MRASKAQDLNIFSHLVDSLLFRVSHDKFGKALARVVDNIDETVVRATSSGAGLVGASLDTVKIVS